MCRSTFTKTPPNLQTHAHVQTHTYAHILSLRTFKYVRIYKISDVHTHVHVCVCVCVCVYVRMYVRVPGYHVYQRIWDAAIGEVLDCDREPDNAVNHYAVKLSSCLFNHSYLFVGTTNGGSAQRPVPYTKVFSLGALQLQGPRLSKSSSFLLL